MPTSWIDKVLTATDKAETPRSYIYWAGVMTISAIVAPNVWINREGVYKLSPNLFTMLIGESGLGKGLPINLSKKLVRMTKTTRVISGRNTISAILKDLGQTKTEEKNGTPIFKDSRGYIISGEFATLLQDDKSAITILTELYDTHYTEDWTNSTKTAGIDELKGVNITLFGGSTPEHFNNVIPESDVKGGFVGRILTVFEEERYKINPLAETELETQLPYEDLVEWLKTIAMVKGPFHFTKDGKEFWIDWYTEIRTKKVHDPTGAVNRLPDNVLKVAMCLSLSRDVDLRLHKIDLEQAASNCMALTIDSNRLTGTKGRSELGAATKMVIASMYRAKGHQIKKFELLRKHYGDFDTYELDRIIQTLESAKLAKQTVIDGQIVLTMPKEAAESIKKLMEK